MAGARIYKDFFSAEYNLCGTFQLPCSKSGNLFKENFLFPSEPSAYARFNNADIPDFNFRRPGLLSFGHEKELGLR